MKYLNRNITIINPVDPMFLSSICNQIKKGSMSSIERYECENCGHKWAFGLMNLHKDFLICNRCVEEKKMDKTTISLSWVDD